MRRLIVTYGMGSRCCVINEDDLTTTIADLLSEDISLADIIVYTVYDHSVVEMKLVSHA